LLTPSIDHLLDRRFIGFEDSGTLIISPVVHRPSLRRMGVETGLTPTLPANLWEWQLWNRIGYRSTTFPLLSFESNETSCPSCP
jgi:hypothetical protein